MIEGRRNRIFRRDEYRCVYCGLTFEERELTLDHVQPRMRGGDQSDGNIVTCCTICNTSKAGEPVWSYLRRNGEQRENFLKYARHVWPRLRKSIEEDTKKRA